jgi:hypothetical protein
MGECRGANWETIATHARFTSNSDENSTGFRPGGLQRLEMLLYLYGETPLVNCGPRSILYIYNNIYCKQCLLSVSIILLHCKQTSLSTLYV